MSRLLRALSTVAPGVTERQAVRLFLTPPRPRPAPAGWAPADARQLSLDVGARRIAGWRWGEGPTVLLLHGWGGRASDMGPIARAVAGAGFGVLAFDMPAHGDSPGRRSSLIEWLGVLRDVRRHHGAPFAVVGHSLGAATTALALADGLGAERAVLLAPAADPAWFLDRLRRFLGLPDERAASLAGRLERAVGRGLDDVDVRRAVATLDVPGLVLHDVGDREVPWTQAREIVDAWTGSRLVAREGTGHRRILGDPGAIAEIVAFLRDDGAGSAARG